MENIRCHYHFYGSVQGVGFRWRACHAAKRFDLTGWVRNCPDGSVELEAEGDRAAISGMLELLENGSFISVDQVD